MFALAKGAQREASVESDNSALQRKRQFGLFHTIYPQLSSDIHMQTSVYSLHLLCES